jgi:two-component system, NarL family, response regulator NreC
MKKIKIILAEDHKVVRQGVKALLDQEKDLQVVGEAGDGLQLLDLTEKLHPDVVVVDLKMPCLNGLEAAREIEHRFTNVHTVILTMHADRSYIDSAFQAGVCGYVLKEEEFEEMCKAIRYAAQGRRYLSVETSRRIPNLGAEVVPPSPLMLLTRRERQVFQLIAEGKTNNEAACLLGISIRTVEVHRAHIMDKLNLKTHIDFVRFSLQHGILADAKPQ